ncbi:MAG: mycothiol system anti-sigma-R factor [Acidimicrobiales bacterium]
MASAHDKDGVDCREALHRIYHFLDGELTADRRSKIEAHVDSCSPCFKMFGFEAELRKLVACRCKDEVPTGLRARIAATIHHEHEHPAGVASGEAEPRVSE